MGRWVWYALSSHWGKAQLDRTIRRLEGASRWLDTVEGWLVFVLLCAFLGFYAAKISLWLGGWLGR